MAGLATSTIQAHELPRQLSDLFIPGVAYPDWQAFNWKQRRFFLKDARLALALLQVPHTATDPYMLEAAKFIETQTRWREEYSGDFAASKTQLYPARITEPKYVDKAAAIIVALALMAKRNARAVDVFGTVRIIPAYFFLDGLTSDLMRALDDQLRGRGRDDLLARLDVGPADTIDQLWGAYSGAPPSARLLREMSHGYCATQAIAQTAQRFLRALGHKVEIRYAGDNGVEAVLGTKAAAPSITPNLLR